MAIVAILTGCASTAPVDPGATPEELVLITHGSFALGEDNEVLDRFTEQTGIAVTVLQADDAGALTNQLVLTKNAPLADVAFGVDTTFASRAVKAGVLAEHQVAAMGPGQERFQLPAGAGREVLAPITSGDVCINIDAEWYQSKGQTPPATLDDLIKPKYRGQLVASGASTSSPGLAFLLATIAAYGENGWQDYWRALVANDIKVTAGWTDAYTVDFTRAGGDRPIVLSYGSSPAFDPATKNLDATCFRQVEYAGVIAGTKYPTAAGQLVDFLFSAEAQAAIPDSMYVFPTNTAVALPEGWAGVVSVAETAYELDPAVIDAKREAWIAEWSAIVIG